MKKCDLTTPASRIRHALENLETVWQHSADAVGRCRQPAICRAAVGADDPQDQDRARCDRPHAPTC